MAKQYIRVGTEWAELFDPQTDPTYLLNASGTSIQFWFSQAKITDFTAIQHPFTVGGLISQAVAPAGSFIYAKALKESVIGDTVVVADDKKINTAEADDVREELDMLGVQVMRLSQRVSNEEIRMENHMLSYTLFLREFFDNAGSTQSSIISLSTQMMRLNMRIFAAERFIQAYRRQYNNLLFRIDDIETGGAINKKVDKMATELNTVMATSNNINAKLNDLIPRIEEAWSDYDQLVKEHVEPLKEEVKVLSTDFTSLNNAMVKFVSANTPEAIEREFLKLIASASDEMVGPITSLKNSLVELAIATRTNEEQSRQIEQILGW